MQRQGFRPRVVDAAFTLFALGFVTAIPTIPAALGKVLFASLAAACITGLILRWGWLLPATFIGFLAVQVLQTGYAHTPEEAVWQDLIYPTIGAAIAAALQVAFSGLFQTASDERVPDKNSPGAVFPSEHRGGERQ